MRRLGRSSLQYAMVARAWHNRCSRRSRRHCSLLRHGSSSAAAMAGTRVLLTRHGRRHPRVARCRQAGHPRLRCSGACAARPSAPWDGRRRRWLSRGASRSLLRSPSGLRGCIMPPRFRCWRRSKKLSLGSITVLTVAMASQEPRGPRWPNSYLCRRPPSTRTVHSWPPRLLRRSLHRVSRWPSSSLSACARRHRHRVPLAGHDQAHRARQPRLLHLQPPSPQPNGQKWPISSFCTPW